MNKTIFVAGATGGIGSALASAAKAEGFDVIAAARDTSGLEGKGYHLIDADFAKPPDTARMALEASSFTQEINVWAYTAGDIFAGKSWQINTADWQRVFDANLNGVQNTLTACLPLLAADAHLFFIGAYTDRLLMPGLAAYAAAKAALGAYTAVLEKELRDRKVTLVRPAAVRTRFWEKTPFKLPENALAPEEVAKQMLAAYHQGLSGLLDL
jgi:NADP-dependent 3-hydroxy acid dehydrogenase YdfG